MEYYENYAPILLIVGIFVAMLVAPFSMVIYWCYRQSNKDQLKPAVVSYPHYENKGWLVINKHATKTNRQIDIINFKSNHPVRFMIHGVPVPAITVLYDDPSMAAHILNTSEAPYVRSITLDTTFTVLTEELGEYLKHIHRLKGFMWELFLAKLPVSPQHRVMYRDDRRAFELVEGEEYPTIESKLEYLEELVGRVVVYLPEDLRDEWSGYLLHDLPGIRENFTVVTQ